MTVAAGRRAGSVAGDSRSARNARNGADGVDVAVGPDGPDTKNAALTGGIHFELSMRLEYTVSILYISIFCVFLSVGGSLVCWTDSTLEHSPMLYYKKKSLFLYVANG